MKYLVFLIAVTSFFILATIKLTNCSQFRIEISPSVGCNTMGGSTPIEKNIMKVGDVG